MRRAKGACAAIRDWPASRNTVTNTGKETHGFEIEGNGIEKALKPRLKKGGSGSLQVDLKPGTYKVYCPVLGHKGRGMSLNLTVMPSRSVREPLLTMSVSDGEVARN